MLPDVERARALLLSLPLRFSLDFGEWTKRRGPIEKDDRVVSASQVNAGCDYVGRRLHKLKTVGNASISAITQSYATGTVTGLSFVGGLVEEQDIGTVSDSYFDEGTTGQSSAFGFGGSAGATALSSLDDSAFDKTRHAAFDRTPCGRRLAV